MTLHHQKFQMIVSKKPNEWKTQEFRVWKCISNKYFHEKNKNLWNYFAKAFVMWAAILGIASSVTRQHPPTIWVPRATQSGMFSIQCVCRSEVAQCPRCQVSPLLGYTTNGILLPAAFLASCRAPLITFGEEQLNPMARRRFSLEFNNINLSHVSPELILLNQIFELIQMRRLSRSG